MVMAQPSMNGSPDPDNFFDPAAIEDYRRKSREFLARSRAFLSEGDLHQASEKGWGAAAWMAKAVATAHGWEYRHHRQFSVVLHNARLLTGDDRLRGLRSIANELHDNYYQREFLLNPDAIGMDLDSVAELLDILEPLTQTSQ